MALYREEVVWPLRPVIPTLFVVVISVEAAETPKSRVPLLLAFMTLKSLTLVLIPAVRLCTVVV